MIPCPSLLRRTEHLVARFNLRRDARNTPEPRVRGLGDQPRSRDKQLAFFCRHSRAKFRAMVFVANREASNREVKKIARWAATGRAAMDWALAVTAKTRPSSPLNP